LGNLGKILIIFGDERKVLKLLYSYRGLVDICYGDWQVYDVGIGRYMMWGLAGIRCGDWQVY
jgi:hypothetical protein